jgi:hypothetical protein
MPGGTGGYDIWKCLLVNGKWSKPQNLGKLFNSPANDVSPYITQENNRPVLFYASDRDGGFGGFDIYKSTFNSAAWQGIELQPAPINSVANENSFIYDPETRAGYVSSDRNPGQGSADIYRIRPLDLKLILTARDSASKEALEYGYIQLYDNNIRVEETVTGMDGISVIQLGLKRDYTLNISKENYRPRTISFSTHGKYNGDSIVLSVALLKDPQFSVKNTSTGISMQNYIVFMGNFTDGATHQLIRPDMRMVNLNTNKLRILDVDENGSFLIRLMTNNNYKIFIKDQDRSISDEITTYGLDHGSIKLKNYILSGTTFKTGDNRVLAPYMVPDSLKYLWNPEPAAATDNSTVLSTILPPDPPAGIKPSNDQTLEQIEDKSPVENISNSGPGKPVVATDNELYYKIQIGSFTAPTSFPGLADLGQLQESTAYGNHIYRLGDYSDIYEARNKLEAVHQKGYNLAFILQYRKDKIISIIK